MFRFMSRSAVVALVATMLLLVAVPALQARPIDRSGPTVDIGADWFDATITWLTNLLFGATPDTPAKAAVEGYEIFNPNGGGYQTNSGSCIDPEGRPRPSCY